MAATAERVGRVSVSIPAFALHWARELGANSHSLAQLKGGINNRVFRCETATTRVVIKGYAPCNPGQRDRMQAEVAFLLYAKEVASGHVPQLLHIDPARRCVVLEHLEGQAYREGVSPSKQDVEAAVEFFRKLNADPAAARRAALPDAAESFLRITEHLTNVRERANAMQTCHLPAQSRAGAAALLASLHTEIDTVTEAATARLQAGDTPDALSRDGRLVNPSDFGFHNAIRVPHGVKFIDFEHAGWDDPAKAVADFVLQPRVPIHSLGISLLEGLPKLQRQSVMARCAVLKPVLRLKWVCIMLAVLRPERLEQLLTTHPDTEPDKLICERLETAARALKQGVPHGLP